MSAQLDESDIVLALAKAQGVLFKATLQILKRDKTDGIRASKWLADHVEVYDKILDEAHDMLDDDTRREVELYESGSLSESPETYRPTLERFRHIAKLLRAGTSFNATSVAKHFELATKTISRDLTFMRDRMGWDFEFDTVANSYKLKSAPKAYL